MRTQGCTISMRTEISVAEPLCAAPVVAAVGLSYKTMFSVLSTCTVRADSPGPNIQQADIVGDAIITDGES